MKHTGMATGARKLSGRAGFATLAAAAVFLVGASPAAARVLRVAQGHPPSTAAPQFSSIQAAVDAARPGDWILIAPGDYHERGDYTTH